MIGKICGLAVDFILEMVGRLGAWITCKPG